LAPAAAPDAAQSPLLPPMKKGRSSLGPTRMTAALRDDPLLRMASDLTHHSARLDSYTNTQAFAFMLTYVPDMRRFFSVPYQLARALVLRFPEHYPPNTTDVGQLAATLLREKYQFRGPPEVERMIRALWDGFAPKW
jgi:hypothetical protein